MPDHGSISHWLDGLKAGDDGRHPAALGPLLPAPGRAGGRAGCRGHARRDFDEEDVALSAFHSFCDRVGRGQFPRLPTATTSGGCWSTITARKAIDGPAPDPAEAGRRPGARRVGRHRAGAASDEGMARFLGREPTPGGGRPVRRRLDRLLARLGNPTPQDDRPAQARGPQPEEIAAELGISARTVDRKLQLIRVIWKGDGRMSSATGPAAGGLPLAT